MKISVIILVKNEEENIKQCLKSAVWAKEIIIIDDYSSDNTCEIAKKFGAKIYKRKLNANFSAQRNYGLIKAKCEWVFFLDADEIISKELAKEISNSKLQISDYDGFRIRRTDYLWGKKIRFGDIWGFRAVRLGRKNAGEWKRYVHEKWEIGPAPRGVQGSEIGGEILHYPHKNIGDFLEKIRKYALIHAEILEKEGVESNIFQIIFYPLGKFIKNYFLKLGFLDGAAGFIHAAIMSFHSFIARSQLYIKSK